MKRTLTFEQVEARWKAMFANRVIVPGWLTAPTRVEAEAARKRIATCDAVARQRRGDK